MREGGRERIASWVVDRGKKAAISLPTPPYYYKYRDMKKKRKKEAGTISPFGKKGGGKNRIRSSNTPRRGGTNRDHFTKRKKEDGSSFCEGGKRATHMMGPALNPFGGEI